MWFFILMSMMVFPKRPSSAVEEVEISSSSSSSDRKKLKNMSASKKAYEMQKYKRENLFERNKQLMNTQIKLYCDNSNLKQRIKVLRQIIDKMTHFCGQSDLHDFREIFQTILSHSTELTSKAPKDQREALEKPAKHPKNLETSTKIAKCPTDHLKIEKSFGHQKNITDELPSVTVDEFDTRSKRQKDAQSIQKRQQRNVKPDVQKQLQKSDGALHEDEKCVKDIDVESFSSQRQTPGEAVFENVSPKMELGMNKVKADQQNQEENFQVHLPSDAKIVFVTDSSMHGNYQKQEAFHKYIITMINDGMCMSQGNVSQCHPYSDMMNDNCEMITLRGDNLTPVDLPFQDSYKSPENENSADLSTQENVCLKNNCLLNVDGDDSTLTLGATEEVSSGVSISHKDKIKEKVSPISGKRNKPMKFKTGLVKRYLEWEMSSHDSRESAEEVFVPQYIKT